MFGLFKKEKKESLGSKEPKEPKEPKEERKLWGMEKFSRLYTLTIVKFPQIKKYKNEYVFLMCEFFSITKELDTEKKIVDFVNNNYKKIVYEIEESHPKNEYGYEDAESCLNCGGDVTIFSVCPYCLSKNEKPAKETSFHSAYCEAKRKQIYEPEPIKKNNDSSYNIQNDSTTHLIGMLTKGVF